MKRRQHAKQRDLNEPAIVDLLRKAGASVTLLDEPVDLLVGYRGCNFLIDVKNPEGLDRMTSKQVEFVESWRGQVAIVRTEAEALAVIGIKPRGTGEYALDGVPKPYPHPIDGMLVQIEGRVGRIIDGVFVEEKGEQRAEARTT